MAFNYKNYAQTPSDKVMYSWIGDKIDNPTYIKPTPENTDPLSPQYDPRINPLSSEFVPELYYYYKPTSLAINITEFKDVFYQAVNLNPSNIGYMGNQPGNIVGKVWQANPAQLVNESQIDQVVARWGNSVDVNSINKTVSWAYVSAGYLASADGLQSSGRTYLGGGAHANDYVIFIASNYTLSGSTASTNDLSVGTWGGWIAMHELGHVFGLAHPDPLYQDLRNTIMAYPIDGFAANKIPLTPGMQDIDWLQNGHAGITTIGASHTTDGVDTYTFTDNSIQFTASTGAPNSGLNITYLFGLPVT